MKNIILIKYLGNDTKARRIETALTETRVDFQVNLEEQCIIVEGNSDMVAVARRVIDDLGFMIIQERVAVSSLPFFLDGSKYDRN